MTFEEVLHQALAMLQRHGRVSYRAFKRQFNLEDAYLDDLKYEIIEIHHLARDQDGKMLVWIGEAEAALAPTLPSTPPMQLQATQDGPSTLVAPHAMALPHSDTERRQLTVLFCDVVDSTALSSQLDAEDYRDVVRAYQATCAEVIRRFDGYIAQYLGDGLLVYFGYPLAHEDDAQRAVRAGLGIVEAMESLNASLEHYEGVRVAVRVGIHTGLVVIGDIGAADKQEPLALGQTPNIAARIQSLASPNTVVVSAASFRLIQGYFACHDLGRQALRGVAAPVQLYHVMVAQGTPSRLEAAITHGLTPFVGRESELRFLLERWAQVKEGAGQVVLLGGESGIGKSRLVRVFTERIAGEAQACLECRGSPYYQHTAFYPITELLERLLWWQQADTPEARLHKLEAALAQAALPLQETLPLFATLLSLPLPEGHYPSLSLSPQRQRQKTLESILALWLALAQQQPVLLIVDDLQWIDPSSLELLGLLVDQAPTVRSLMLMTFRPTFVPPWGNRSHVLNFTLLRLTPTQVHAMITGMTGGKGLPDEVLQHLVSRTDGVPLFVEEMTKAVLESELLTEQAGAYELTESLSTLDIPATLQDSLKARLDRLSTFKAVAQLGAALGRTFSYELLRAVSPLDETTLQQGLRRLIDAELLYQRGVPPQAIYFFKHALIQEAAYQSLLRSIRQQYHQRIAYVLSTRFPDSVAIQPELLAHHYTEAGLLPSAVDYWQQAGQRAIERSAHLEAISHLTRGLEVLKMLPETPLKAHQELSLQTMLGPALRATKGYAAPDVERAYARARELCQRVGETPQLFPVLWGLLLFYLVRAELQTAYALAQQLFDLSQRQHDPNLLLEAHIALGMTLFQLGEPASALEHLEQGMTLYNPQLHRTHAALYGQDPGVFCLSYGSWALWFLGYPDQALERVRTALTLAREGSHPYSLVFALTFAARIYQCRRDVQAVQTLAEEIITLSTEQGFAYYLIQGMIQLGWAVAQQGHSAEGLERIRQGLRSLGATGTELGRPGFLIQLAEGYTSAGQTEAGLAALTEALSLVEKKRICCWEAELYRLKGEFLLALSEEHAVEAESCMCQALAIAQRQQARSWELRAAMSLGRLWRRQGKSIDASRLLSVVYDWFTEGRDTIDLTDAKTLLESWT